MLVRDLTSLDSIELSSIHLRSFDGFFLSSLGRKFLTQFYSALLKDQNGVGVGIEIDGQICCFAVGSKQEKGFYKALIKRNGVSFIASAFIPLISRPNRILQLLNSFKGGGRKKYFDSGTLLSICVDPKQQTKGLGIKVLAEFEKRLIESGCDSVSLTTDAKDNERVNDFYLRSGYELIETFYTAKSREMNLYLKNVKQTK